MKIQRRRKIGSGHNNNNDNKSSTRMSFEALILFCNAAFEEV
jgi:hypothetical protein